MLQAEVKTRTLAHRAAGPDLAAMAAHDAPSRVVIDGRNLGAPAFTRTLGLEYMSIEDRADALAQFRSGSQVAVILSNRGAVASGERHFNVAHVVAENTAMILQVPQRVINSPGSVALL